MILIQPLSSNENLCNVNAIVACPIDSDARVSPLAVEYVAAMSRRLHPASHGERGEIIHTGAHEQVLADL